MRVHPSLIALMQQGLQARREGRSAAAQAVFLQVLRAQPEQPDALVLLAEADQAHGDLPAAAAKLQRAVRADPQLLVAWSRLASLLEDLDRIAEAERAWAQALRLQPAAPQVLYNRARLLQRLGRATEAMQDLNLALQQPANTALLRARMLQLQALLQEDAGALQSALQTLEQALQLAPERAALHHNRGVLLQRLARPADALAAHDRAMALGLQSADAEYNRGNTLQSLGRPDAALAAYAAALDRDPQHALALFDIARLRWRMGHANFTAELDAASLAAPASPLAYGIKAGLLLRAGLHDQAGAAFQEAVSRSPGAAGYHDGLGQALSRLGRFDAALIAHRQAVTLAPQQAATHISHASTLLQAGRLADATCAARTAVQCDPLDQQAWAMLGLAWRATGDPREAWLNDYARHVQVFDLPPPPGWPDMASFNRALAAELEAMHTDAEAPIDQTLRHGSQTLGNIFEQDNPLVQQLKGRIAEAIAAYIAGLAALQPDSDHPLLRRKSGSWRFSDSWSSRLRSSGFHTQHVHPHGWISSCYYVDLPGVIAAGNDGQRAQAGWISFGQPDIVVPDCALRVQRSDQPRAGRLLLFPSFMWHGTVPFEDARQRLTVAFDVVPAG